VSEPLSDETPDETPNQSPDQNPLPGANGEPIHGTVTEEPPRAQVRRLRPPAHRTSGRERHDEKITVYVSSDELFALEQARLVLRAEHGIATDRGRLVREAVAEMLLDLDTHGEESVVVRRLRPQ
jgi:hypothetical protein